MMVNERRIKSEVDGSKIEIVYRISFACSGSLPTHMFFYLASFHTYKRKIREEELMYLNTSTN